MIKFLNLGAANRLVYRRFVVRLNVFQSGIHALACTFAKVKKQLVLSTIDPERFIL